MSHMLNRVFKHTQKDVEHCPACQEADCYVYDVELVSAPEVLIVFVDRSDESYSTPADDCRKIHIEDQISVSLPGNGKVEYCLNGMTLIQHCPQWSHVVSAIRSRHDRYWMIDN